MWINRKRYKRCRCKKICKHSWSPTVNKLFEGIIKKIKGWEEEGVKLIKIFPDGESNEEEEEEKESLKKNQYYKKKKKKSGCC